MVARVFLFSVLAIVAGLACGQPVAKGADQGFPSKPIRILTSEVGGGNDFASRLMAPPLSVSFAQQVIVENRAGIIAVESAAKAQPDGYTILVNGSIIWVEPLLRDNAPWNAIKSFTPITLAATAPNVLVIHPSVTASTVKELVALARTRPGALNYASGASGTAAHTAAELFKWMAGVNIVRVPYRGSGPAVIDLIGGRVQLMFATAASVSTHLKSGKLRALAVTSDRPSALAPGLPTVSDSGLPGYRSGILYAVLAPAATPANRVKRLSHEIAQALTTPDLKDKFFNAGFETVGSTPEQLLSMMKSEIATLGRVVKDAGIRAD